MKKVKRIKPKKNRNNIKFLKDIENKFESLKKNEFCI